MNILDIDFIIFNIAGTGVSLLEILSVFTGLTCVFLAGRGKAINYWFGYVYAISLFFLFAQKHLYSSMLLQPISIAIAIFGHYQWTHPKEGHQNKQNELKITILTNRERAFYIAIIAAFTLIWGFCMQGMNIAWPDTFPAATRPFLDAFVVGTILIAQFLSAKKKLDCWAAWLIINITNIALYLYAGLVFMPMVSAAYLVLAFFGIAMWRKQWINQDNDKR